MTDRPEQPVYEAANEDLVFETHMSREQAERLKADVGKGFILGAITFFPKKTNGNVKLLFYPGEGYDWDTEGELEGTDREG